MYFCLFLLYFGLDISKFFNISKYLAAPRRLKLIFKQSRFEEPFVIQSNQILDWLDMYLQYKMQVTIFNIYIKKPRAIRLLSQSFYFVNFIAKLETQSKRNQTGGDNIQIKNFTVHMANIATID